MKHFLLLIDIDHLAVSNNFNKSMFDFVFNRGGFHLANSLTASKNKKLFGEYKNIDDNFNEFEPVIESCYFDLWQGRFKNLIISFYDVTNSLNYGLVKYNIKTKMFELYYVNKDRDKFIENNDVDDILDKDLSDKIIDYVSSLDVETLGELSSNVYVSKENKLLIIDQSKISENTKTILNVMLSNKLNTTNIINIKNVAVDIEDLNNPLYVYVEFECKDKKYEYWFYDEELKDIDVLDYGEIKDTWLDIFINKAEEEFIRQNKKILIDVLNKKNKDDAFNVLSKLYKKFKLVKCDDGYGYIELNSDPFIYLDDDNVKIKTSRNIDDDSYVVFDYINIIDNKNEIKKVIDRYISSKPKEYDTFIKEVDEFINNIYDLDTSKQIALKLLEKANNLSPYDKTTTIYEKAYQQLKNKYNQLINVNKTKVSNCLTLLNKIVDINTYNTYCDAFNDAVEECSEGELSAFKNEYDDFLNKYGYISNYPSTHTVYRRVFIRKSVLEDLKKLDIENKGLKILSVMDDIVDNLKTLPGNELGKYLLNKGLNFPIKNDRSIKKIRILRNAKYRLLFVYGSDLNDVERNTNSNSVYIFALTMHKKDSGELYTLAKTKPNKYKINDFIIYPKNKLIKIPECTSKQYEIASSYKNRPLVTFGCAGSGKTTVSIEQYVNIVYNNFNCASPKVDELVYITFHKGLSDKVKKDLLEFHIDGNCYKLDEYFAYVVGEEYNKAQIIDEHVFVSWFNKTYSKSEIKKNKSKKKNKISPLLNKPDIARLIYTYYRGVFKGSKELYNSKDNYLDKDTFMLEMSGETYLSDEEKNAIYLFCLEFNDYAFKNNLLSDNDYALKVIRQSSFDIKKTNCIIIDEVQDLTEIETIATILTLNDDSARIYFYGDPHQSINPNVFDSSTINRVYTALGKSTSSENAPLTITYRTNKHLIKYLNQLLKYRDKWIGATKEELSQIEEPPIMDEDTSWAGYVTNKELYNKIFITNPRSMIITPSEEIREKLLDKYKQIDKERVITIYDAKGMEWDTIIMYNIFSDYKTYFLDMILENGCAKKSTIHRMTFNKYYVGCTRSTKSFVIVEEDEDIFKKDNPIFKTLLSSFAPISKKEQIDTYILEDNTFDAWYKEAVQNLSNDNTSTFEHALKHARSLAKTNEEIRMVNSLIDGTPEHLERSAFKYLEEGEYDLSLSTFIKCNKINKRYGPYIILCALLCGRNITDEHLKEILKHQELFDKYPSALPKLMTQKVFINKLTTLSNRLFNKEEK